MPRPRPSLRPLSIPHDSLVEEWLDRFDSPDSIDEHPEYSLNLGAETPSTISFFNDPSPTPPPRLASRRNSLTKIARRRSNSISRDCGICFEFAVQPARVLCCGVIFCREHLTAWLHGPSSDGRCPSCSAPCSGDTNILSLGSPAINFKTPRSNSLAEKTTPGPAIRNRSQSTSTSASKQSQLSDSSLSSSDSSTNSSVLGLAPTSEANPEDEDDEQHWLAYALNFGHTRHGYSAGPSPYPFIHPGSSTVEVIGRLTSVMGLTLLLYALLAS